MPKKPKKGSERPRAWLYGVLNPLVESLEREKQILARGNLTWRQRNGQPEFLAAPEHYLGVNARQNLRDLLKYYSDVREPLERHGVLLADAVAAAKAAHDELVSSASFQEAVLLEADEWKLAFPQEGAFWSSPSQLVSLAAERIVNEVDEVPVHYVDSTFWSIARKGLAPFRTMPRMLELKAKRASLAADTDDLLLALVALQEKICDEYDLPPAPYLVEAR